MAATDKGKMLAALLAPQRSQSPLVNALAYAAPPENALHRRPRMEEILALPPQQAYNTQLSPQEELAYRQWMQAIGHTPERGYAVDQNYNGQGYDYRGFFKKNGPVPIGEGQHFTDEFKTPYHETFSNESQYAQPGTPGAPYAGSWQGETYTPSLARYIMSLRKPR